MRLIHTSTLRFQEFFDTQLPQYAILSHTWETDEISYWEFLLLTSSSEETSLVPHLIRNISLTPSVEKAGFKKAQACCELAQSRGIDWVWIDSCCIDKSSSAELSEAINSMWTWYHGAWECYVYLSDVSTPKEYRTYVHVSAQQARSRLHSETLEKFRRARWFSRGWTLQELLAPKHVHFCNNRWEIITDKSEVGNDISDITGIPLMYLNGTESLEESSIAQKMSWVSRRDTTRLEDRAYCMLGLFDVHMPLIYGEGRKAFMRLQLEILKKSRDQSLFAWTAPLERSGLLATWPTAFADCGNIVRVAPKHFRAGRFPYAMTNVGLEIRRPTVRPSSPGDAADDSQGMISMVPPAASWTWMLECGRVEDIQESRTDEVKKAVYWNPVHIDLRRFGPTMQRVSCERLESCQREQDDSTYRSNAYTTYYVEQQGL